MIAIILVVDFMLLMNGKILRKHVITLFWSRAKADLELHVTMLEADLKEVTFMLRPDI